VKEQSFLLAVCHYRSINALLHDPHFSFGKWDWGRSLVLKKINALMLQMTKLIELVTVQTFNALLLMSRL
jgi:hypothetical protein